MTKIKLLLLEDDDEYAEMLVRQLALKNRDISPAYVSWGAVSVDELKSYDLLIAGDGAEHGMHPWAGDGAEHGDGEVPGPVPGSGYPPCVYLGREPESGKTPFFFRYGRISELASLLRLTYGRGTGKARYAVDFTGNTRLTGFLSGAGGTGKTAAALTCCRLLAREQGKSVLYLSFEEWDSTGFYVDVPDQEKSQGDFLYYLYSAGQETMASWLAAYLFQDSSGVYYLFPPTGRNELLTLSQEELIRFFAALLRYGEFDCIVADLPAVLSDQIQFIIRSCQQLVLVTDGRAHSAFQTSRLKEWLTNNAGFSEDEVLSIDMEWDSSNFLENGDRAEVELHRRLGREVAPIAEQLAE